MRSRGFIGCRPRGDFWVLLRVEAGMCSRLRTHFFCFAKRSKQEKATRRLGPCAALRATCGARIQRGLAKLASLKQRDP